jgi:PAS domain S-box-containing protein
MGTELHVIIIEDCTDDVLLVERELHLAGFVPLIRRIESAQELRQALVVPHWDLVIADYSMPHFDGLTALQIVREHDKDLPFILISGKIGEETAVEVLKAGAHNYIMKDRIKLLGPAVSQSLQDARLQRQTRELERTNRVLARAVEQSPVSILITDTGGIIQHVNPKLCQLTGYTTEELIGQKPRIFQSGTTEQALYRELWTALLGGKEWHGTFCNRKKDGTLFWEEVTIAPVRDKQGNIIQFVAVKEDISDRIRLEQDLQRARADAECAAQAKLRFLQIMSHELRTPLNVILGTLQLSELDQTYDAEMTTYAKTALFSMLDTIDNILEASQLESAEHSFKHEPVHLEQILGILGRLFSVAAQNKGLLLRLSLADNLPRKIISDGSHLQQILAHLLNNAIKFTEKGTVELYLTREEGDLERTLLKIEVRDTGIGIDPEAQQVIFELFTQADDSNTRRFGGAGLGLYLTKRLVELMGGTITLQSVAGNGSIFTVRLPLITSM